MKTIQKKNDKKCAYPKCFWREKDGKSKSIFRFPTDKAQLDKWMEKIPFFNMNKLNLETAVLCADHFEESLIEQTKSSRKLKKGAIPTIFKMPNSVEFDNTCRLCLRSFKKSGEKLKINDEIKKHYQLLTSRKLSDCGVYSEIICQSCNVELIKSSNFKFFIIKNQDVLYETFKGLDDQIISSDIKDENYVKLEDHKEEVFTIKTELEDPILNASENFDSFYGEIDDSSDFFNENMPIIEDQEKTTKKSRKAKTAGKLKITKCLKKKKQTGVKKKEQDEKREINEYKR